MAYGAGHGAKPQPDVAWATLSALLDALAVDRCEYRADVVAALFRRAPVRVPASVFGFRGPGVSYSTSAAEPMAGFRPDDAVTMRLAADVALRFDHNDGTPRSADEEVRVCLGAGDWVAYDVVVPSAGDVRIEVAVPGQSGSDVEVAVDGEAVSLDPQPTPAGDSRVGTVALEAGRHVVRITGGGGGIVLRWFDVLLVEGDVPSL